MQLALSYPAVYVVGLVAPSAHEYWWRLALWSIQMSGPTFVKFFQWASTRQDIFPKSFCARFATLQSNARTHSWRDTQRLMAASFGVTRQLWGSMRSRCLRCRAGLAAAYPS